MKTRKTNRLPLALLAWFAIPIATAQTFYVSGPVDQVSSDFARVTVLGQTYAIDSETKFSYNGKRITKTAATRTLQGGGQITIEGVGSPMPTKASSLVISSVRYVPGATTVFVGGTVEQVSFDLGTLKVGGLTVDISATAPEALSTLKVGSFVELSGIQPSPQGLLLGDRIAVSDSASLQSIGGTGANTSLQSIGGTGTSVSLQSIGGTGATATLQSIGGTGKSASLQSIGGTGASASRQSIGGTGKSASLQSIGGTGSNVSLQSIGGTGASVSLESIGGTGKGALLQSIGGTGTSAAKQSIGGTGASST